MPQANIWIRKENYTHWQKVSDKSQLVNNLLERHFFDTVDGGKTQEQIRKEIKDKQWQITNAQPISATVAPAVSANPTNVGAIPLKPLNTETKDYSLCKHGNVKGFCKQGCK